MRPVTRRQADSYAARSAATQAQVMSTLERLLDSGEAFRDISVQRLLEEAGVSRATFYAHFPSKSDVLVRLTDGLRESLLALARQWDPAAGEDGADRFARFFEEVLRIHRAHQGVITAVREAAAYDSAVGDFYTADLEGFEEAALRTLLAEQAAGSTTADLDAVAASRIIAWGGAQAIAHHIQVDDGSRDAVFARELARIWWYGAYRRPADARQGAGPH
ncbi:TetR/AcrR family transcriptional regulator [Streptomyces sp. NPDC026673]|uniref:TetR/AcrR family transcriptional regulator n=1 Tax=Streptomyces sp. NPDC026673 TaxID=3155724 RepID=UPI0033EA2A5C